MKEKKGNVLDHLGPPMILDLCSQSRSPSKYAHVVGLHLLSDSITMTFPSLTSPSFSLPHPLHLLPSVLL